MKTTTYVWCEINQQNKPIKNCPKCGKFPCKDMTAKHIKEIGQEYPLRQIVSELTKRKVKDMFFLEMKDGKLDVYTGDLDKMDAKQSGEAVSALEVDTCFEQKLSWVPEEKADKIKTIKSAGKKVSVVEYRDGTMKIEEVDPATPNGAISKIYPVKKKFVKSFIPVKVAIDTKEKSVAKPAAKRTRSSKKQ